MIEFIAEWGYPVAGVVTFAWAYHTQLSDEGRKAVTPHGACMLVILWPLMLLVIIAEKVAAKWPEFREEWRFWITNGGKSDDLHP